MVYDQHGHADTLTVAAHLKATGEIEQLNRVDPSGVYYLHDLQARIVETENTEFHAEIVRDMVDSDFPRFIDRNRKALRKQQIAGKINTAPFSNNNFITTVYPCLFQENYNASSAGPSARLLVAGT